MKAMLTVLFCIMLTACDTTLDYKPVECSGTYRYQGKPLYQSAIDLPDPKFDFADSFDDEKKLAFDNAMQAAIDYTNASAMTAAVATKDSLWAATKTADQQVSRQTLYWASVGKALTATVIMQLEQEGKLSLDDTVQQWLPQLPNADAITIDHLLQHTSGLFSYNEDLQHRNNPGYLSPEESLQISAKHGAMFCPGHYWRYTNTGYIALGIIIEAIEGQPYHQVVNTRIIAPLKLHDMRALAPEESTTNVAPLTPADSEQAIAASWPYAAGNVVSSAEDMIRFWHALLTGQLLNSENTSHLFEQLYPMFDDGTFYGRGVMLYAIADINDTWLGHSGGAPGANAVIAYSSRHNAYVAVALTGDGSAHASANLLLKQLAAEQSP